MSSMAQIERFQHILNQLNKNNQVLVNEMAADLKVSTETIRRDLDVLQMQGQLKKIHGGAVKPVTEKIEPFFMKRKMVNMEVKRKIAEAASEMIEDDDVIAIEIGSTTLYLLDYIKGKKNLTILTNAIPIVNKILDLHRENERFHCNLVVVGGILNFDSMALSGFQTEIGIRQFSVNKFFATCDGLSLEKGITSFYIEDAQSFYQYKSIAKNIIMLADETKFNVTQFYKSGELDDLDQIVTDAELSEKWKNALDQRGVELIQV